MADIWCYQSSYKSLGKIWSMYFQIRFLCVRNVPSCMQQKWGTSITKQCKESRFPSHEKWFEASRISRQISFTDWHPSATMTLMTCRKHHLPEGKAWALLLQCQTLSDSGDKRQSFHFHTGVFAGTDITFSLLESSALPAFPAFHGEEVCEEKGTAPSSSSTCSKHS